MDHVSAVRQILDRVADNLKRIPKPDVETHVIEDPARGMFVLYRVGWQAGE